MQTETRQSQTDGAMPGTDQRTYSCLLHLAHSERFHWANESQEAEEGHFAHAGKG